MKTVVYADVYFLVNFSIDFVCLYLCGAVRRVKPSAAFIVLASVIGGVYSCVALFIENELISAVLSILCCLIMYFVAYKCDSIRSAIFGGVMLFLISALFGGTYSALLSFASGGKGNFSRTFLLLIALVILLAIPRITRYAPVTERFNILVKIKEKSKKLCCMVDSGNVLREPISGIGVALVCEKSAKYLFNENEISALMGKRALSDEDRLCGLRSIVINTAAGNRRSACMKCDYISRVKSSVRASNVYFTVVENIDIDGVECLLPYNIN